MSTPFNYTVFPTEIDTSINYHKKRDFNPDFILFPITITIIAFIVAIIRGHGTLWIFGLLFIAGYFLIRNLINANDDANYTKDIIAKQINKANKDAEFYTKDFNSILSKSDEIVNQILPYFEASVKHFINKAKIEFSENAYSPYWSEIEEATKYLACYKEALSQLCLNREVYTFTLSHHRHNFPIPFPLATNISISQTVIDEYKSTIRKAHTNPTFSIIWEQRRNSQILIGGFRTLENAIANMSNDISSAISELNHSIRSELNEMKYVQKEQLKSFESSQAYLTQTLNSMDTKLYYIQWDKKPLGAFYHR